MIYLTYHCSIIIKKPCKLTFTRLRKIKFPVNVELNRKPYAKLCKKFGNSAK